MWLLTPFGFFSVVRKPQDVAEGQLTIRSRVRADLEALRETCLPGMGEIVEGAGTDYRYRARVPRAELGLAMANLVSGIDYENFKDEVKHRQGSSRAQAYAEVWSVLAGLRESPDARKAAAPSAGATARGTDTAWAAAGSARAGERGAPVGASGVGAPAGSTPPRSAATPARSSAGAARPAAAVSDGAGLAAAWGGVLVDHQGRVLLREPKGHYDGYVWTFAKGRQDRGETPEQTALREVREETGYPAWIVAPLPGLYRGGTTVTGYFLMLPAGEPGAFCDQETAALRWAGFEEAASLIALTRNATGRARDLAVLAAAREACRRQGA